MACTWSRSGAAPPARAGGGAGHSAPSPVGAVSAAPSDLRTVVLRTTVCVRRTLVLYGGVVATGVRARHADGGSVARRAASRGHRQEAPTLRWGHWRSGAEPAWPVRRAGPGRGRSRGRGREALLRPARPPLLSADGPQSARAVPEPAVTEREIPTELRMRTRRASSTWPTTWNAPRGAFFPLGGRGVARARPQPGVPLRAARKRAGTSPPPCTARSAPLTYPDRSPAR